MDSKRILHLIAHTCSYTFVIVHNSGINKKMHVEMPEEVSQIQSSVHDMF